MAFRLPIQVLFKNHHLRSLSPISNSKISDFYSDPPCSNNKCLTNNCYKDGTPSLDCHQSILGGHLTEPDARPNLLDRLQHHVAERRLSLEDHLKPKCIKYASPRCLSPFNSKISVFQEPCNRYLDYLQKDRKKIFVNKPLSVTHSQKDYSNTHVPQDDKKQIPLEENRASEETKRKDNILARDTRVKPMSKEFLGTKSKVSERNVNLRNVDALMDIHASVRRYKLLDPRFKPKKLQIDENDLQLKFALNEIMDFFEEFKSSIKMSSQSKNQKPNYVKQAKSVEQTNHSFNRSNIANKRSLSEGNITKASLSSKHSTPEQSEPVRTNVTSKHVNEGERYTAPYQSFCEFMKSAGRERKVGPVQGKTRKFTSRSPAFEELGILLNHESPESSQLLRRRVPSSSEVRKSHFSSSCSVYSSGCNFNDPCKEEKPKDTEKQEECTCEQPVNPECPFVVPTPPKYAPPLTRLPKVKIPEKPKICPDPPCTDVVRADDGRKIKRKDLPKLQPGCCPCVEQQVPCFSPPLCRLKKKHKPKEPPKVCPVEECPPRADDCLTVQRKSLPCLVPADCPPLRLDVPRTCPPLPRLFLKVDDPIRVCEPCVIEPCCPPRADDGLKIKQKQLPCLKAGERPCIEPYIPTKCPRLKRLGKIDIPEPIKVCPSKPDCPKRQKVKRKKLPALRVRECPKVSPDVPKVCPKLKRLPKFEIPEPKKVCPPPPCDDVQRADDNLKIKSKKLRPFQASKCPCIEPFVPTICPRLRRLNIKSDQKRVEKVCSKEECPPRADDGLKFQPKSLPPLVPSDCPVIKKDLPMTCPKLVRLNIKLVDPPPTRVSCVTETCPPRADEDLVVKKKKLPPIKPCDCPCTRKKIPCKAPTLKRLRKVCIPDPVKVCPKEECPPLMDANYKIKPKVLPTLILKEEHNTMSIKEFNTRKKTLKASDENNCFKVTSMDKDSSVCKKFHRPVASKKPNAKLLSTGRMQSTKTWFTEGLSSGFHRTTADNSMVLGRTRDGIANCGLCTMRHISTYPCSSSFGEKVFSLHEFRAESLSSNIRKINKFISKIQGIDMSTVGPELGRKSLITGRPDVGVKELRKVEKLQAPWSSFSDELKKTILKVTRFKNDHNICDGTSLRILEGLMRNTIQRENTRTDGINRTTLKNRENIKSEIVKSKLNNEKPRIEEKLAVEESPESKRQIFVRLAKYLTIPISFLCNQLNLDNNFEYRKVDKASLTEPESLPSAMPVQSLCQQFVESLFFNRKSFINSQTCSEKMAVNEKRHKCFSKRMSRKLRHQDLLLGSVSSPEFETIPGKTPAIRVSVSDPNLMKDENNSEWKDMSRTALGTFPKRKTRLFKMNRKRSSTYMASRIFGFKGKLRRRAKPRAESGSISVVQISNDCETQVNPTALYISFLKLILKIARTAVCLEQDQNGVRLKAELITQVIHVFHGQKLKALQG